MTVSFTLSDVEGRQMSKLVGAVLTAVQSSTFAVGALALSPVAQATTHLAKGHSPTQGVSGLIDTDRVVGIPQQATVPSWARPGGLSGRGDPVAPTITTEPQSETVAAGSTASFFAAASGTPTPTVQWEQSTNGGTRWSTIRGATSTTYSFTASAAENGDEFEAVFRNFADSATSTAATLTVGAAAPAAPKITSEPTSESVTAGSTASFSAAATGTPTPTVQWWESTNSGSSFSPLSATSTAYSFTATSSENGDEFYAVFTNGTGSATTNTVTLTVTAALVKSSNWSGYADLDATFDAVGASWTVPTLNCSGRTSSYSAQWIGIDGYSSNTVEQDGTEADCLNGSPSYDAWYEMYGDSAVDNGYEVELNPASGYYPVSPGDTITASVSVSGSSWTLSVADSTQHWNYSTPISFSGASKSSAEWIVERPEVCSRSCSLTSLADYGSVTFSNATASVGSSSEPISSYANTGIEMENGTTPLATPGALNATGNGFTDVWQAS